MIQVGDTIALGGISAKGRQRVKRDGELWRVTGASDRVQCFGAPAWRLEPVAESALRGGAGRWIRKDGDSDFRVA